ncbi:hypothetical protein WR25_12595 isoform G [Diploscapter pachys]|uniref:Uncharacterized protein n=1 Tax=Diploscapter pachys TaxID=2018661 RepID=A0A2A2KNP2_9BILA|nr:hypothetical protein WR25_12595 isoform G [Diploscapter pachys]
MVNDNHPKKLSPEASNRAKKNWKKLKIVLLFSESFKWRIDFRKRFCQFTKAVTDYEREEALRLIFNHLLMWSNFIECHTNDLVKICDQVQDLENRLKKRHALKKFFIRRCRKRNDLYVARSTREFIQNTLIMRLTALKGVVSRAKDDFEQFALTNEEAQVSKNNQFINDKIGVFQEVLSTSLLNLTMHCNDQIDHISAIKHENFKISNVKETGALIKTTSEEMASIPFRAQEKLQVEKYLPPTFDRF